MSIKEFNLNIYKNEAKIIKIFKNFFFLKNLLFGVFFN